MTYNHAFTLTFAVSGSKHVQWRDALKDPKEKPAVIKALYERIRLLEANDAEYQDALEGFDTRNEDN